MANKIFKGLKFPGMDDYYVLPEAVITKNEDGIIEIESCLTGTTEIENLDATLTKEGYAADAKAVGGALEAKAPAGFGLGSTSVGAVTLADIDGSSSALIPTGWYRLVDNLGVGITIDGIQFNPAQMRIESESLSGQMSITLFRNGDPIVRRSFIRGFWNPWEWISPPYEFGEVYRTTERYRGYPVYAFLLPTGGFASGYLNFTTAKGFTDDPDYVAGGWTVISYDRTVIHDGFYGAGMMESTGDYSLDKYVENIRGDFTDNGLSVTLTLKSNSNSIGSEAYMNLVVKFVKQHV